MSYKIDPPRCHGEGEIEVGTHRDEFGNWDTETFKCPGCPDCAESSECTYPGCSFDREHYHRDTADGEEVVFT